MNFKSIQKIYLKINNENKKKLNFNINFLN